MKIFSDFSNRDLVNSFLAFFIGTIIILFRFSGCLPLPHEALLWTSSGVLLAFIFAFFGIITTFLTTFIFLRHNHTPVVKSTTRELSYIILSGQIFM